MRGRRSGSPRRRTVTLGHNLTTHLRRRPGEHLVSTVPRNGSGDRGHARPIIRSVRGGMSAIRCPEAARDGLHVVGVRLADDQGGSTRIAPPCFISRWRCVEQSGPMTPASGGRRANQPRRLHWRLPCRSLTMARHVPGSSAAGRPFESVTTAPPAGISSDGWSIRPQTAPVLGQSLPRTVATLSLQSWPSMGSPLSASANRVQKATTSRGG